MAKVRNQQNWLALLGLDFGRSIYSFDTARGYR
jgi:hypothetical protein